MLPYVFCIILIGIGLYAVLTKKNLLKIVIGFCLIEYGVNLFIVMVGYRWNGLPPIMLTPDDKTLFVDPIPQALVLTAIVIGLATTAVLLAIVIRVYKRYGTLDLTELKRLKG
ncbi:MAG: cation:proton antiporter subunit C [bacterium]